MPKSNIEKIAENKPQPAWLSELPEDGSVLDVIGNKFRKVLNRAEAVAAAVEAVNASNKLTDFGKEEKLSERGADFLEKHEELTKDIEAEIPGLVSKAKAKLAKPEVSEIGQLMAMMRGQEIRRDLAAEIGSDSLKLETRIREAEATGDVDLLDAVLNAHPSSPLQFDRAELTRRRDSISEDGGMTAILIAQSDLQDRLDWAAEGIRSDTGLGIEDNIAAIANDETA